MWVCIKERSIIYNMSKLVRICCTMCSRDLLQYPLPDQKRNPSQHVDMYIVDDNGRVEHYCPKCYNWMARQGKIQEIIDKQIAAENAVR